MQALVDSLEGFGSPRVLLVGDFMLDSYVYGDVERISPEAPVPVLREVPSRRKTLTGGAGNPAQAIIALGGEVACIGVIGQDAPGDQLVGMLTAAGPQTAWLVRIPGHPTTVKTRYVGLAQHRHAQQMFRVDSESADALDDKVYASLRAAVRGQLTDSKVLAIEDYNKGVLSDSWTPQIIADAKAAGLAVVVDPALINDYRRYRGATLLTPNRYEASLASGIEIIDDDSLQRAAAQLLLIADAEAIAITLDKEGAYLYTRDGVGRRIPPARPRAVYDVTGAGDVVLAMLAVALGSGCEFDQAVALANVAGGLEVEHFGVVPISRDEVVDELRRTLGLRGGKVMDRKRLAGEIKRRRANGEQIVFTNGCFDLLHMGHVRYLRQARELGSALVVGVNSDDSVRRLKGPDRPVISQDERAEMLGALECVDYVTIFDEDTAHEVIEVLRPEIFAKGGSTDEVVERDLVEGYGGQVLTLDLVQGASTTEIIDRIVETNDGGA